jgi:hypothetical protein
MSDPPASTKRRLPRVEQAYAEFGMGGEGVEGGGGLLAVERQLTSASKLGDGVQVPTCTAHPVAQEASQQPL